MPRTPTRAASTRKPDESAPARSSNEAAPMPHAGAAPVKSAKSNKAAKAPKAPKAPKASGASKAPQATKAPKAAKRAAKTMTRGAAGQLRRSAKARAAAAPAAPAKPVRIKLIRDSFTMPKPDFELIGSLKQRALSLGREVKKSELLRAGLRAMAGLGDGAFLSAVAAVPRLKTGRPHHK